MKIRLELLGPLKLPPSGRSFAQDFRRGVTVRHILRQSLGYSSREMELLHVVKDGRPLHLESRINEDATLLVILRLGGG